MGNLVGKMQDLAPPAPRNISAGAPAPVNSRSASAQPATAAQNNPVINALRTLPQEHATRHADVVPPNLILDKLDLDVMTIVASKLDLNAAKSLRLANKAFKIPGASRFTNVTIPPSVEMDDMVRLFSGAKNVRTLRIGNSNNFGNQQLAQLVETLLNKGLTIQNLDLSDCQLLTDTGLAHLVPLTSLRSLNLGNCGRITDTGLEHVARLTALHSLGLSGCRHVTDAGLANFAGLTSLQTLDLLGYNDISQNALAQLRARGVKVLQD